MSLGQLWYQHFDESRSKVLQHVNWNLKESQTLWGAACKITRKEKSPWRMVIRNCCDSESLRRQRKSSMTSITRVNSAIRGWRFRVIPHDHSTHSFERLVFCFLFYISSQPSSFLAKNISALARRSAAMVCLSSFLSSCVNVALHRVKLFHLQVSQPVQRAEPFLNCFH